MNQLTDDALGLAAGHIGRVERNRAHRLVQAVVHFFCYHLLLRRSRTQVTRAAGFRLAVRPSVFHPRYFISSECFAAFIDRLDLDGLRVADVGTGSGILALAAARAGAAHVVAADINPNAALSAADNARANGLGGRVSPVCSDLLSAFAPRPLFDVILANPPWYAGEPVDLADRAWHAGPDCRDIAALFVQMRERLNPGGRAYIMVSSNADLGLFDRMIAEAGLCARLARKRAVVVEHLLVYELVAR